MFSLLRLYVLEHLTVLSRDGLVKRFLLFPNPRPLNSHFPSPMSSQVDERHVYLCAAAPLKEDMEYIRNALLTATFKVGKVGR